MPNGRRRGGAYTRGGKTFHRKGAKIAKGKGPYIAGAAIGVAVFAAPLLSNPAVVGVGLAAVLGVVAWKNRRHLRSAGRKVGQWARNPVVRQRAALAVSLVGSAGCVSAMAFGTGGLGLFAAAGVGGSVAFFRSRAKTARAVPAVYRTPKPSRAVRKSGAYLDSNLAPHRADGKYMPIPEWEQLYYGKPVSTVQDPHGTGLGVKVSTWGADRDRLPCGHSANSVGRRVGYEDYSGCMECAG